MPFFLISFSRLCACMLQNNPIMKRYLSAMKSFKFNNMAMNRSQIIESHMVSGDISNYLNLWIQGSV